MTPKSTTSLACDYGVDHAITNSTDHITITKVTLDGSCDYQEEDNIAPSGFRSGAVGYTSGVDITIKFATSPEAGTIDISDGTGPLIPIPVISSQLIYTYTAVSPVSVIYIIE